MDKVMLTQEEVKALESALTLSDGDKAHVVQWRATELFDGERAPLNEMDLNTVCRALYVGYEVEESPEDKILKFYKSLDTRREFSADWHVSLAITKTLNLLNIKIKGINCQ